MSTSPSQRWIPLQDLNKHTPFPPNKAERAATGFRVPDRVEIFPIYLAAMIVTDAPLSITVTLELSVAEHEQRPSGPLFHH